MRQGVLIAVCQSRPFGFYKIEFKGMLVLGREKMKRGKWTEESTDRLFMSEGAAMKLFQRTVGARRSHTCLSGKTMRAGVLDQKGKSKKQYDRPQLDHGPTIGCFETDVNVYLRVIRQQRVSGHPAANRTHTAGIWTVTTDPSPGLVSTSILP